MAMRAVIPAAGKGTRMFSVTGGAPKELLPLGGMTVFQRILETAYAVCDETVVVWDIEKGPLPGAAAWVPQMPKLGLASAIASGVTDKDRNLVLLPDAVFKPYDPGINLSEIEEWDIALALLKVEVSEVSKYGICELDAEGFVTRMLEKPSSFETESQWAISGRYMIGPKAAGLLIEMVTDQIGTTGEMDMSPFFAEAMNQGMKIFGMCFDDVIRYDTGDPAGYQEALVAWA